MDAVLGGLDTVHARGGHDDSPLAMEMCPVVRCVLCII